MIFRMILIFCRYICFVLLVPCSYDTNSSRLVPWVVRVIIHVLYRIVCWDCVRCVIPFSLYLYFLLHNFFLGIFANLLFCCIAFWGYYITILLVGFILRLNLVRLVIFWCFLSLR